MRVRRAVAHLEAEVDRPDQLGVDRERVPASARAREWGAGGLRGAGALGLGAAAITAAVIWIVVAASQGGSEQATRALRVGPGGELTWTF